MPAYEYRCDDCNETTDFSDTAELAFTYVERMAESGIKNG